MTTTLPDWKSTRLNSSHLVISYAVFCLKKKKNKETAPGHSCPGLGPPSSHRPLGASHANSRLTPRRTVIIFSCLFFVFFFFFFLNGPPPPVFSLFPPPPLSSS